MTSRTRKTNAILRDKEHDLERNLEGILEDARDIEEEDEGGSEDEDDQHGCNLKDKEDKRTN